MAVDLNSLPRMICLEDFGGNYAAFIDAVYQVFFRDFMQHKAMFGSHRLHLRYHPAFQERPYAFYHMTHKGDIFVSGNRQKGVMDGVFVSGWMSTTVTITLLSCTSTGIMCVF